MAYSFQTFSLNQILTSAQMNQQAVNIRDHVHGVDGVNGTFTGSTVFTGNTTIGSASNADINFISGVNSNVQYQFNNTFGKNRAFVSDQRSIGITLSALHIPFDTENEDTGGFFDVSSNTLFVIPNASFKAVQISGGVRVRVNSTCGITFNFNGAYPVVISDVKSDVPGKSVYFRFSTGIIPVSSGDTFYNSVSTSANSGAARLTGNNWMNIAALK